MPKICPRRRPATILVFVGSLNGLILPLTLGAMLLGAKNKKIVGDYEHPTWLLVFGILAVLAAAWAGWMSLQGMANLWK
jgi:Mn2+/Fe2+ NRAMP family transporter